MRHTRAAILDHGFPRLKNGLSHGFFSYKTARNLMNNFDHGNASFSHAGNRFKFFQIRLQKARKATALLEELFCKRFYISPWDNAKKKKLNELIIGNGFLPTFKKTVSEALAVSIAS